jgi:hypothetical protein
VLDARVVGVAALQHREPEALHGATLDLTLDESRVDRLADVEALDEPRHLHLARLVVHLDLGRAGGVRDRCVRRQIDATRLRIHDRRVRVQMRTGTGDQLAVRPGGRDGDVGDGDLLLRSSLRGDHSVLDLEIGSVDLELLARDLQQLRLGALGRLLHGHPGDERRPRGERAGANGR